MLFESIYDYDEQAGPCLLTGVFATRRVDMIYQDWEKHWYFTHPLREHDLIECPICHVYSTVTDWRAIEVYCEDCGDVHDYLECPECHLTFDSLYDWIFEVA